MMQVPLNVFKKKNSPVRLLLIALILMSAGYLYSQNCSSANITLNTQTQVNNFQANFGPCSTVTGNFVINDDNDGVDNITDLSPLIGLTHIGIGIFVNDCDALTNLDGLDNLIYIDGDFFIVNNDILTNLDVLGNLTNVDLSLFIDNNAALTSLNLSALTNIGLTLSIKDNPLLTNVNSLSNLTNVGLNLEVLNNANLSECCGLNSLLNGGTIGNNTLMNNNAGNCNNHGADVTMACAVPPPPLVPMIPTMGEWALFLFLLIIVTLGTVTVYNTKHTLTTNAYNTQIKAISIHHLPFDETVFRKTLKWVIPFVLPALMFIQLVWGEIVMADVVGLALCIPIVGYLVHIIILDKTSV